MTVLITLTTAGADSGPFDLYTNLDGYVSAFATGVSKSALLAGYTSSAVPDFATIIRVKSTGDCVNYIDITLVGTTTTTTTTIAPTTTTTTTAASCAEFELSGGTTGRTFNFTNCEGISQTVNIPAGDSAPFCIRLPFSQPGATNIGECGTTTTTTTIAPTTTTTTTAAFSNELSLHLGLCADVFFPDYTYYVSQTIPNVVLQNGDIAYFEPGFITPINGLGQTFTGFFNSIKYQFVINNVGVISSVIVC